MFEALNFCKLKYVAYILENVYYFDHRPKHTGVEIN